MDLVPYGRFVRFYEYRALEVDWYTGALWAHCQMVQVPGHRGVGLH